MNLLGKSALIGALAGAAVFGTVFAWQYSRLLAQQPGVATDGRFTSYPPSAAWIVAAPWALLAFFVVAACILLLGKTRKKAPTDLRSPTNGDTP